MRLEQVCRSCYRHRVRGQNHPVVGMCYESGLRAFRYVSVYSGLTHLISCESSPFDAQVIWASSIVLLAGHSESHERSYESTARARVCCKEDKVFPLQRTHHSIGILVSVVLFTLTTSLSFCYFRETVAHAPTLAVFVVICPHACGTPQKRTA